MSRLTRPGNDKRFYSRDTSVMSRWHIKWWQDNHCSANGNLLFRRKASFSCSPKDVYRPSIFFFPHHYPLALAVNKSPAVYILSPALDGLWRENRGSVNRLFLSENARFSTSFNNKSKVGEWNDAKCLFVYTLSTKNYNCAECLLFSGHLLPLHSSS